LVKSSKGLVDIEGNAGTGSNRYLLINALLFSEELLLKGNGGSLGG